SQDAKRVVWVQLIRRLDWRAKEKKKALVYAGLLGCCYYPGILPTLTKGSKRECKNEELFSAR
ncbi:MAG: hypothetical protein ACU88J_14555, partial [Gammaproteobacteria bacterium]